MNRSVGVALAATSLAIVYVQAINSTASAEGETDSMSKIDNVPFPGSEWFSSSLGGEGDFIWDGVSYPSAYGAMVATKDFNPVRNFNCWINSFIISDEFAARTALYFGSLELGHYAVSYLRNLVAGAVVYYLTSSIFHYFCYIHPMSKETFKDRKRPDTAIIVDQIQLATASIFMYVMLPVLSDWLIEENYTLCYYTFEEIGGFVPYLISTIAYFTFVEIGIYWMHRTLHTNKFLYKHVHMLHHKYNSPETLTPWASIAFNPIDGILQACPYVICMFFVPCHYLTHIVMVFFTAIWSTYIHDAMDFNIDPIMGSKYHTVHHTHYMYNFGQVFTFCDAFWGTLKTPISKTGIGKVAFKKNE